VPHAYLLTHSALCLRLSRVCRSRRYTSLYTLSRTSRITLLALCLLADTLSRMPASHYFTCLDLEGRGRSLPLLDTGVSACVSMSSLLLGLTQTCDRGVASLALHFSRGTSLLPVCTSSTQAQSIAALLALNVSRSRSLPQQK